MEKKYEHKLVETGLYEWWMSKQAFASGDRSKQPFSIVIPPPNVTGKLHLGHAWDSTIQDIIVRRKRMQGFDTLWLPGMDHAGIATQAKVDERLKAQGISRYDLGREKFLDAAWAWKSEYAQNIKEQWAKLGLSLDYSKERFTLDEGLNESVNHVFISLYNKGLIYQGERIIHWDPQAKTALSNIEVEYLDVQGAMYHFRYVLEDGSDSITIATTRPETMFGDTALMVHPEDKRYTKFVGKRVVVPGTKTLIPVITDSYVDMEFGTGAVKVTPAHDPNDYQIGIKYQLEMPLCMNEDGTMNERAFQYHGLDRFVCRKQLVKDLQALDLCPLIEPITHSVGHSERTGAPVEPRLSKQWFVKMEPLAKAAIKRQQQDGVSFVPARFEQTFLRWMDDIQDWCISRQLWWGHRIPAWFNGDEVLVQVDSPGEDWTQEEDVLDTWFSSALWPFSTFGWPELTEDFKRYYPTSVLVTGYDIIFFWVARMIFQAEEFTQNKPFDHVVVHGLIRDEQGRKMSKSLGNGVDPMDVIATYGADALRYMLTTSSTPGQDVRFSEEKVESSWNFLNKVWNLARFVLMNVDDVVDVDPASFKPIDRWIVSRFNTMLDAIDGDFDRFEFGEAAKQLVSFAWDEYAAWYVEMAKLHPSDRQTKAVLLAMLEAILKLLHPFSPFMTEHIYQQLPGDRDSISLSAWPTPIASEDRETNVELMIELVTQVRNTRSEYQVPLSKPIDCYIQTSEATQAKLTPLLPYITKFINPSVLEFRTPDTNEVVRLTIADATIILPMSGLVDMNAELERLIKEQRRLQGEISRSDMMLSNELFLSKAPDAVIEIEEGKRDKYIQELNEVENAIKAISS
jgi:valyl-tRNA synthetase